MKRTLFVAFFLLIVLLSACEHSSEGTQAGSEAESHTEDGTQISTEVKRSIEGDLKEAAIDDIWIYAREVDGKLELSVHVDPAVTNYMLALNLEPVIEKLKEDIDLYRVEVSEFEMSAVYYKNGEPDSFLIWESSDLETGQLISTREGVVQDATLSEAYEYCEYTPGDYKNFN